MLVTTITLLYYCLWFKCDLLLLSGDVELNTRPKQNSGKRSSICHRKLNSIVAHDFSKLVLLKPYNSIQKFDLICLSEVYLDLNTLSDPGNCDFLEDNLVRSDHLLKKKRGSAFITHKC